VCKPIPDWAWNGEIVEFFGEIVSHDEYKVSFSEIICFRVPERITLYSLLVVLKRKRKWMNTFVMMMKTTMYLLRYSSRDMTGPVPTGKTIIIRFRGGRADAFTWPSLSVPSTRRS
jgi:hypothetical protein